MEESTAKKSDRKFNSNMDNDRIEELGFIEDSREVQVKQKGTLRVRRGL